MTYLVVIVLLMLMVFTVFLGKKNDVIADVWARRGRGEGPSRLMTHENGRRVESKDDTGVDACLEQLARAISAHVTDILIERLGLEEKIAHTHSSTATKGSIKVTSSTSPRSDNEGLLLKHSISRTKSTPRSRPTPRSVPQSPTPSRGSRLPRPINDYGVRTTQQQFQTRCSRARGDDVLLRYHSDNRLNRITTPDLNETPLENRASRLRRANAGRKLAGRDQ